MLAVRGWLTCCFSLTSVIALTGLLSGCSATSEGPGYYWQSVSGHLAVMSSARPIDDWLADSNTEPWLKNKLILAREVRQFASAQLGLPDNGSYTKYVDLKRQFVVWNVFATPELSMQLKQWCYPVVGCASYRGFYKKDDAQAYAKTLVDAEGSKLEPYVSGVPAYSTLGWFDDPLLSSFIRYPDAELARLIIHELSHQILYVQGDTTFNESFATAVEELGLERWLTNRPDQELLRKNYAPFKSRRHDFVNLLKKHRAELEKLYASAVSVEEKRAGKRAVFAALQHDYRELKQQWGGFNGYDNWFAQDLSNAHLATVATYNQWVPAFRQLFKTSQSDFKQFYAEAKQLSRLNKAERDNRLTQLAALNQTTIE